MCALGARSTDVSIGYNFDTLPLMSEKLVVPDGFEDAVITTAEVDLPL